MIRATVAAVILSVMCVPANLSAQSNDDTQAQPTSAAAPTETDLLTEDELQTLVGPVALYPDTLLIQVLVASTFPLEVVKADRFLTDNADSTPEDLKPEIEAQGWDESVSVLATAFPDVLADMAVHVEWTEAMGTAMLAQSDDVMTAVQDMRVIASENGALESGEEQTIEVTQEAGDQTITIQPADPQTVYVPQYDPQVVYAEDPNNTNSGDILATTLITFGTVALISEIFDDDDDWYGYWGCRSYGGWNGQPIIRNPDIDIDVDGNVNIGNRVDAGWKPDDARRDDARDKISDHRKSDAGGKLPMAKPDRGNEMRNRLSESTVGFDLRAYCAGNEMRNRLSESTGAADISRPNTSRAEIDRTKASAAAAKRPKSPSPEARQAAVDRSKAKPQGGSGAAAKAKAKAPVKAKPRAKKAANTRASGKGHAVQKRAGGGKAKAGGQRGRSAAGKRRYTTAPELT